MSRILSVREQIASELHHDVDTMILANEQILASYFETQEHSRLEENHHSSHGDDNDEYAAEHDDCGGDDQHTSLTVPYSDASKSHSAEPHESKNAFDRYNAMVLLSNSMVSNTHTSSPLRKGNFDLMLLLSTQESIHRVLRLYANAGDERAVSFAWLKEYYLARVSQYFDGHQQQHGRADDFLEELLLTPPVLKAIKDEHSGQEIVGFVDPLRMAEDIIRIRSQVGRDWKSIAENIPQEHMALRRMVLAQQMGDQMELESSVDAHSREGSEGFEWLLRGIFKLFTRLLWKKIDFWLAGSEASNVLYYPFVKN